MAESEIRPPRLNGRYVVTQLVGKGAQARVYLAYDTRLRQWRAVKVLASQFLDDDQIRTRFDQEAQAMARLSHANLLRVVDVDQDSGTPFMVMELARGGSIVDWMKRNGKLRPRRAVRIAQQCCDGLTHAHALGVVHRDIKPHNLLIKDDGTTVITDFGIAQLEEAQGLTATGSVMGTFVFMAPEQRSDSKGVDARADVYSLGASLFTMLTTRTSAELFIAESRDKILDGVPDPLRGVILRACKYDREERYGSMAELRQALDEQLEALPPDPDGPGLPDVLLRVPEKVPETLAATSGVEDLLKVLASGVASSSGDPRLPARIATPVRSATPVPAPSVGPISHHEDGPTVLPYQMPKFERETLERARRRHSIDEEPDEDTVPDWIDQSTLDRKPDLPHEITAESGPMPSRSGPSSSRSAPPSSRGPKSLAPPTPVPAPRATAKPAPEVARPRPAPTMPPSPPRPTPAPAPARAPPLAAAAAPAAPAPPLAEPASRGSVLALGVFGVLFAVLLLLAASVGMAGWTGVKAKREASAIVATAGASLVKAVADQDGLLQDLAIAGADDTLVRERWFAFRDGTGEAKTLAAAAFVEVAVAEAHRIDAPNLVRTQAAYLDRVRSDWVDAREQLERVRRQPFARLTGDVGI